MSPRPTKEHPIRSSTPSIQLRLPDDLAEWIKAKAEAAEYDVTTTTVIRGVLRKAMDAERARRREEPQP